MHVPNTQSKRPRDRAIDFTKKLQNEIVGPFGLSLLLLKTEN